MHVELFCVCKSATQHQDDTLDVRGIHDNRGFTARPDDSTTVTMAVRLRFEEEERGTHQLQIVLFAPDGARIGGIKKMPLEIQRDDWPVYSSTLVDLPGAYFAASGTYRLSLHINGLSLAERLLTIRHLYDVASVES
jgi:hypothetical protein